MRCGYILDCNKPSCIVMETHRNQIIHNKNGKPFCYTIALPNGFEITRTVKRKLIMNHGPIVMDMLLWKKFTNDLNKIIL